jgi:hypothetical protein
MLTVALQHTRPAWVMINDSPTTVPSPPQDKSCCSNAINAQHGVVAGGRSRVAKAIALQLTSSSNLRVLRVVRDFRVACFKRGRAAKVNSTRLAGPMWIRVPADRRIADQTRHACSGRNMRNSTRARTRVPSPDTSCTKMRNELAGYRVVRLCGAQHQATEPTHRNLLCPMHLLAPAPKQAAEESSQDSGDAPRGVNGSHLASVREACAPVDLQFPRRLQLGVPWP